MLELSVSDWDKAEEVCGKVKDRGTGQGCGSAGLVCCADRSVQLFAVGQLWFLVFEFSEMSPSASILLLLALHALRIYVFKYTYYHILGDCSCITMCEVCHLLYKSITYSSSTLLLCFLRHRVSQLLWDRKTCENRKLKCVRLRLKIH